MSVSSGRQQTPKFRCNSCLIALKMFESPTVGSIGNRAPAAKQFFTSCYHVLCNDCRFKNGQNCAVCNRQCQFMGCTSNMPKFYRLYFEPALNTKNHLKSVMKFQRLQNSITNKRLAAKIQKLKKYRIAAVKKEQEVTERSQRTTEKLRKYKMIHRKICQEKRWVKRVFVTFFCRKH